MVVTTSEIREAAIRFVGDALRGGAAPPRVGVAAAGACEQLVLRVADYVGSAGARALFERSLALEMRERPWLAAAVPGKDESPWVRLRDCLGGHEPEAMGASVALVATFLTLFSTFVGQGLTFRILHQHWPDAFPVDGPAENT